MSRDPLFVASLTLLAGLLASPSPARAACRAARSTSETLPRSWQVAVDQLLQSTAEPGHPWSCSGGTILLTLDATGAVLQVALEGETPVTRHVTSPDDVLPLGQALLSMPLAPAPQDTETREPTLPEGTRTRTIPVPATQPPVPSPPGKPPPRLLLSGGVDARHVGHSRATWLGPVVSAAVPMGRWLPGISLRQQSSVRSGPGGIRELSVAVSVNTRVALPSTLEWRAGLAMRAATVERDLPDHQGEQGRWEGRIGAVTALVIPVFRWGNLVVSADAEMSAISHERRTADVALSEAPRPFPTYTLGGSAMLEVPR